MSEPTPERLIQDARRVLKYPFWIPELQAEVYYSRLHDDHDGTFEGELNVIFTPDGDAHVSVGASPLLRFRMPIVGGGNSPRTRNALILLALAIKLDNEEHPNKPASEKT